MRHPIKLWTAGIYSSSGSSDLLIPVFVQLVFPLSPFPVCDKLSHPQQISLLVFTPHSHFLIQRHQGFLVSSPRILLFPYSLQWLLSCPRDYKNLHVIRLARPSDTCVVFNKRQHLKSVNFFDISLGITCVVARNGLNYCFAFSSNRIRSFDKCDPAEIYDEGGGGRFNKRKGDVG